MTKEDEDLLDLMVRIAGSPEEWERIHRVLSQLGSDKETSTAANKDLLKTENQTNHNHDIGQNINSNKSINISKNNNYTITRYDDSRYQEKQPVTPLAQKIDTTIVSSVITDQEDYKDYDTAETDTGWPDFKEAIMNKIKKHNRNRIDINKVDTFWYEDNILDRSINTNLDMENNKEKVHTFTKQNLIEHPVRFIPSKTIKESSSLKDPHVIRSRLFKDPKILEFPLKDHTVEKNGTSSQNSSSDINDLTNKTSRPVFQYHRVTTSPQERKNSAFIAVSVVKQSSMDSPVTDSSPVEQLENTNHWSSGHYSHWTKGRSKHLVDHTRRKRPHTSGQWKHHSRDHRHHHTEPHTHL